MNDGKQWVKKVDDDLRQYIVTKECRNHVSNTYFDNPPRFTGECKGKIQKMRKLGGTESL